MKYILPTLGIASAAALFAFSATHQDAIAVEKPKHSETFEQLELFADVMARVNANYVVEVENTELIDDAINGMLRALDPHSSYVTPKDFEEMQSVTRGDYGGLGMTVDTLEGVVRVVAPIDGSPAKRAGIKTDDFLTAIDGESILGLTLDQAIEQMRGEPGSTLTVTVITADEEPRDLEMTREIINRPNVVHEIKDGIPYVRIAQFNEKSEEGLLEAIDEMEQELGGKIPGLVLDLRGNPGGLLEQSIKVSSTFLDGGEVVSTRGRRASETERYNAKRGQRIKNVPIIVLIDRGSASASEIVAGALQDRNRALVLGLSSFGKGSVQSVIPLGRGGRDGALRLTTAKYYTPAGRSIQGTGIHPDLYVSYGLDTGNGDTGFRESDLPNAIRNEKEKIDAENADKEPEIKIDYPSDEFNIEDDYQLTRAIEILKSGNYKTLLDKAKP